MCSLPIFLWHHITILISAEWRDLRPPGLARGRRPGSARGLRQGQITLCLSLLLHHDPSRGDAGTDRGHLRRIHARREKAFPGLRDPPVASNAIQGKPFRGRTLHRVSVRWSRMEDSVLEEKFKLQISILLYTTERQCPGTSMRIPPSHLFGGQQTSRRDRIVGRRSSHLKT